MVTTLPVGLRTLTHILAHAPGKGLQLLQGSPPSPRTCLHSMQLQVEAVEGLQALRGLHVLGISDHADVDRDLEVILLLAYEGIVAHGEVEPFVRIHPVRRWGAVHQGRGKRQQALD